MAVTPPRKLMLIAVDVDTGTIRVPDDGTTVDPHPRVVGMVDEQVFDNFVATSLSNGNAKRANRGSSHHEPFDENIPGAKGPAKFAATIVHTHNSPGCTWVIINGWPFCIG